MFLVNNIDGEDMKKIYQLLLIVSIFIFTTGCTSNKSTAQDAVKVFLDQYNNLNSSVLTDLENIIKEEDFNEEQRDLYRDIIKKQYSDMVYEVESESYNGNNAIVKTKITVYDLYKVQNEVNNYMRNNQNEFVNNDGVFDNNLYLNYRLKEMNKVTDRVDYTIDFRVKKDKSGNWMVQELDNSDLEKIHGIYNYDIEN